MAPSKEPFFIIKRFNNSNIQPFSHSTIYPSSDIPHIVLNTFFFHPNTHFSYIYYRIFSRNKYFSENYCIGKKRKLFLNPLRTKPMKSKNQSVKTSNFTCSYFFHQNFRLYRERFTVHN